MLWPIRRLLLVLLAVYAGAQSSSAAPEHLISGANIFIEPMKGFEDYLAAAIHTKHVPLVVVTEKDKADFTISGSASGDYRDQHHQHATIKVVNKSGTVVFAYAFDQDHALHGKQTAAEACAKNLKKEIVGH
jgi:hypothetical protein